MNTNKLYFTILLILLALSGIGASISTASADQNGKAVVLIDQSQYVTNNPSFRTIEGTLDYFGYKYDILPYSGTAPSQLDNYSMAFAIAPDTSTRANLLLNYSQRTGRYIMVTDYPLNSYAAAYNLTFVSNVTVTRTYSDNVNYSNPLMNKIPGGVYYDKYTKYNLGTGVSYGLTATSGDRLFLTSKKVVFINQALDPTVHEFDPQLIRNFLSIADSNLTLIEGSCPYAQDLAILIRLDGFGGDPAEGADYPTYVGSYLPWYNVTHNCTIASVMSAATAQNLSLIPHSDLQPNSYTHNSLTAMSSAEETNNIVSSISAYNSILGVNPIGFVPPGNFFDGDTTKKLHDNGFRYCSVSAQQAGGIGVSYGYYFNPGDETNDMWILGCTQQDPSGDYMPNWYFDYAGDRQFFLILDSPSDQYLAGNNEVQVSKLKTLINRTTQTQGWYISSIKDYVSQLDNAKKAYVTGNNIIVSSPTSPGLTFYKPGLSSPIVIDSKTATIVFRTDKTELPALSAGTHTFAYSSAYPVITSFTNGQLITDGYYDIASDSTYFSIRDTNQMYNKTSVSFARLHTGPYTLKKGSTNVSQVNVSNAGTATFNNLAAGDYALAPSISPAIPPSANFSVNVSSGNAPLTVKFSDTSTGFPTSWLWNFGNGNTSNLQNPVNTFVSPGNYTVNLTVSNPNGTNSTTRIINVKPITPIYPIANFTSNVTSGYVPLSVQFTDLSRNATSWLWNFGDGNTSNLQNPVKTFVSVGNYTVNLTVNNANGTNSTTKVVTVKPVTPIYPVASFTSNVTQGYPPLSVKFNDTSTGTPTSWLWNFGDGNTSNLQNPVNTFVSPGNYTVNLTVSNANGTNSTTRIITVNPASLSNKSGRAAVLIDQSQYVTNNPSFRTIEGTLDYFGYKYDILPYSGTAPSQLDNYSMAFAIAPDTSTRANLLLNYSQRTGRYIMVTDYPLNSYAAAYNLTFVSNVTVTRTYSDNVNYSNPIMNKIPGGVYYDKYTKYNLGTGVSYGLTATSGDRLFLTSKKVVFINQVLDPTIHEFDPQLVRNFLSIADSNLTLIEGSSPYAQDLAILIRLDDFAGYTAGADYPTYVGSYLPWYNVTHNCTIASVMSAATVQNFSLISAADLAPHSYTHNSLTAISSAEETNNIVSSVSAYNSILGVNPIGFVPPGNFFDGDTTKKLHDNGFRYCSVSAQQIGGIGMSYGYYFNPGDEANDMWILGCTQQDPSGDYMPNWYFDYAGDRQFFLILDHPDNRYLAGNNAAQVARLKTLINRTTQRQGWYISSIKDYVSQLDNAKKAYVTGNNIIVSSPIGPGLTFYKPGLSSPIVIDSKTATIVFRTDKTELPALSAGTHTFAYSSAYPVITSFTNGQLITDGYYDIASDSTYFSIRDTNQMYNKTSVSFARLHTGLYTLKKGTTNISEINVSNAGTATFNNLAAGDYVLTDPESAVTPDNLPLSSIINLRSTSGATWINWTWQNPIDLDFDHVEIHLNGVFQTNASSEYFNSTGLEPETNYTLSTRAVDIFGNVNETWVNSTATAGKQLQPAISIFKSVISPDENGDCIVNSAGDTIPYRIVIKNEGNVDLTGVKIDDPLISLPKPDGDNFDLEVLNPGEAWAYSGVYKLTSKDVKNKNSIKNTATVSCNELPDKSSTVETPIVKTPGLTIYKSVIGIDETGDRIINEPGEIAEYQAAVRNNGNMDLTEVSVSDPMVELTRPKGDHDDEDILSPGETWVYTGDYEVTQADIDNIKNGHSYIKNTATVSCNELPDKSSSYVLPIYAPPIDIRINPPEVPPEIIIPDPKNEKVLPEANFRTNINAGKCPLPVQFTDFSQNVESMSWDFNNDGTADSHDTNPVYLYTVPGTYTAKLTVTNPKGTDYETATIKVLQPNSSNHNGNGHHGTGTGKAVIIHNNAASDSTDDIDDTDGVIKNKNSSPDAEQHDRNKVENINPIPEQKDDTGSPANESKKTAGFEVICGIAGLLAVYLYRRK